MKHAVDKNTRGAVASPREPAAGLRAGFAFYALAVLGAGLCLAELWARPKLLIDGAEVGALARAGGVLALLVALPALCGWVYQMNPLLGGAPWRSPRLPWVHFGLHFGAVVWIGAAHAGFAAATGPAGGWMVLAGVVLLAGHHLATVEGRVWWEPANVLTLTALGWLVAAVGLLILPGAERWMLRGDGDLEATLAVVAIAGAGLPLLLAGALRAATVFLGGRRGGGALGWAGWMVLNAGVVVAGAGTGSTATGAREPGAWIAAAGFALLALALVRAGWGAWQRAGASLGLVVCGAFLLPAVLVRATLAMPGVARVEPATWAAWWSETAALVLAGPALALALGVLARALPLFGWLARPDAGTGPERGTGFALPLALAWLLGAGYLFFALREGSPAGVVFAAVTWLSATVWLVAAVIRPGLTSVKAAPARLR